MTLHLVGETPRRYFDAAPHVRVLDRRSRDRARSIPPADFEQAITVPADLARRRERPRRRSRRSKFFVPGARAATSGTWRCGSIASVSSSPRSAAGSVSPRASRTSRSLTDPRFLRANLTPGARAASSSRAARAVVAWMLGVIDAGAGAAVRADVDARIRLRPRPPGAAAGAASRDRSSAVGSPRRSCSIWRGAKRSAAVSAHIVFQTAATSSSPRRARSISSSAITCCSGCRGRTALALLRRLIGLDRAGRRRRVSVVLSHARVAARHRLALGARARAGRQRAWPTGSAASPPAIRSCRPTSTTSTEMLAEFDAAGAQPDARRARASRAPSTTRSSSRRRRVTARARAGRAAPAPRDRRAAADETCQRRRHRRVQPGGRGVLHRADRLGSPPGEAVQPGRGDADAADERRGPAAGAAADAGHDRARVRRRHPAGCRAFSRRWAAASSCSTCRRRRCASRASSIARQPVVGEQPAPEFLRLRRPPDRSARRAASTASSASTRFTTRRIPRAMIREFARVLVDGRHRRLRRARPAARGGAALAVRSRTPTASSSATWTCTTSGATAQCVRLRATCGCACSTGRRITCRSQEYEDLLAGGPARDGWLASTRTFLRHVRSFYLVKEGAGRADSRSGRGSRVRHPGALATRRRRAADRDRRDRHQHRHRDLAALGRAARRRRPRRASLRRVRRAACRSTSTSSR